MNFHDQLDEHGTQATSGDGLRSAQVRTELTQRVRRGRRFRIGATSVGAVLVLGGAAFAVTQLPFFGGVNPGPAAGPALGFTTIEFDGGFDGAVTEAPFIMWNNNVQCGTPWKLEPGLNVHNAELMADLRGTFSSAEYMVFDDGSAMEMGKTVWAGFATLAWDYEYDFLQTEPDIYLMVGWALIADGEIAGFSAASGSNGGAMDRPDTVYSGVPGDCGHGGTNPDVLDGDYEPMLVFQAIDSPVFPEAIFTWVVPTDPATVSYSGVEDWWANAAGNTITE
jgi:hypothetical protein